MDEDLDRMTREELVAEAAKLRRGVRAHRDSSGQELCWHHPALWALLPDASDPLPAVPEWPEFLRGCIRYRQSLDDQLPHAPRSREELGERSAQPEKDAARIRELEDLWRKAAARRDLDGMLSIYAPEARELLPGIPAIEGRDAIRAFYAGLIARHPHFANTVEMDEVVVAASGDLAVVRGRCRFIPDTRRADQVPTGKFAGIWRKADGDWRLYINISNADAQE